MRTDEMRILYDTVGRIKISPVQAMIRQRLTNFKMMGTIECTSLIYRIITNLGIANPRTQIDEAYLT
jgi:hypothetical protein